MIWYTLKLNAQGTNQDMNWESKKYSIISWKTFHPKGTIKRPGAYTEFQYSRETTFNFPNRSFISNR